MSFPAPAPAVEPPRRAVNQVAWRPGRRVDGHEVVLERAGGPMNVLVRCSCGATGLYRAEVNARFWADLHLSQAVSDGADVLSDT